MGFNEIMEMALNLLTDYNIADYSEEDLKLEMGIRLNMVIAKAQLFDLNFNSTTCTFDRELTGLEATILAHGLLMQWLYPMVHNSEVLATQLTSKEYTAFSNANRINSMIQLQKNAQSEFYYLVNNYDFLAVKQQWKEDEK